MQFDLEKILINGANSTEQLRALANQLNLKINSIGTIFDLKFPLAVGNYIILITPDKKTTNGHWVALKVGKNRSYYFDSYGQLPPRKIEEAPQFKNSKNGTEKLYHNRTQIQGLNHTHYRLGCGYRHSNICYKA